MPVDPEPFNLAIVRGCLSSEPVARQLPSGDTLWSYEISVRGPDRPTDTVPVVLIARRPPASMTTGDAVVAIGRVRRRFFRAGGATVSRTEVVADQVLRSRARARVDAAMATAIGRIERQLDAS